jgi:N-sulfoglucosamine sulfohydrolase
MYAGRSIDDYTNRAEFELYDLENDPYETRNLAKNPAYGRELQLMKEKIYAFQERTNDPWILKWDHQ